MCPLEYGGEQYTIARESSHLLELIDIGSNLTHESFAADLDDVLERARRAGVLRQIVTGADLASSRSAAALASAHPDELWSTAGIHPHHAAGYSPGAAADFAELLAGPRVVAVGECGLDYYRDLAPRAAQRSAFAWQLELAVTHAKPVFLHQRDAHEDFMDILRDYVPRLTGGVAHCFTGGPAELDDYLGLGLSIGVTGWVCDERRGSQLRAALPLIPPERLLIETDAPYLLPRDLRLPAPTRRNEPAFLPHIAAVVAARRGEPLERLAQATTANAAALFRL